MGNVHPLDKIKKASKLYGVSINDIFTSVMVDSLKQYALQYNNYDLKVLKTNIKI
jgi:hypothetical protein